MENDTYVIVVFYSVIYVILCVILFVHDLHMQYRRMIRFAFC